MFYVFVDFLVKIIESKVGYRRVGRDIEEIYVRVCVLVSFSFGNIDFMESRSVGEGEKLILDFWGRKGLDWVFLQGYQSNMIEVQVWEFRVLGYIFKDKFIFVQFCLRFEGRIIVDFFLNFSIFDIDVFTMSVRQGVWCVEILIIVIFYFNFNFLEEVVYSGRF